MHDPISTTQITYHGGLAFFGALVHASNAHRTGKSKTLLDFAILTLMSSFSGVMFAIFGLYLFPESTHISMAMAGTGGYLGVEGMTLIVERLKLLITK